MPSFLILNLSIDHAFPLLFHHGFHLFELCLTGLHVYLVFFHPLFDLFVQFFVPSALLLEFCFVTRIGVLLLCFQILVLMVEGLTNFIHLIQLLPILIEFVLIGSASLTELLDLHLKISRIEHMSLKLFNLDPLRLDLIRQSLNFYRLEDGHKRQIIPHTVSLIVRQSLDLRPIDGAIPILIFAL